MRSDIKWGGEDFTSQALPEGLKKHKGAGLLQRSPSIHGILHEIRGLGGTRVRPSTSE